MIPFHDWYLLRAALLFGVFFLFVLFAHLAGMLQDRKAMRRTRHNAPHSESRAGILDSEQRTAVPQQPAQEARAVPGLDRRAA